VIVAQLPAGATTGSVADSPPARKPRIGVPLSATPLRRSRLVSSAKRASSASSDDGDALCVGAVVVRVGGALVPPHAASSAQSAARASRGEA